MLRQSSRYLSTKDAYKVVGKPTTGQRNNRPASKPKGRASDAITSAERGSTSAQVQGGVSSHARTRNAVNNESSPQNIPSTASPHHDQLEQPSLASFLALRAFLSYAPDGKREIPTYDQKDFISLVNAALADNTICYLIGKEFSSLIRLLGTLSILPASTDTYSSHRISLITSTLPHSNYWTLVARIAEAKVNRGEGLTASDHYWLMRMELALVPDIAPRRILSREFHNASFYPAHYSCETNSL